MSYRKFEEYNIETVEDVKRNYKTIIEDLGEDPTREGLLKTQREQQKQCNS